MYFAKRRGSEGAVNRKDLSTDPLLVIYFALAEFYLLLKREFRYWCDPHGLDTHWQ